MGYYLVEEMYTDSFVNEIKRRCKLSGDKYPYRGVRLEDFSKEWRINQLNGLKYEKRYAIKTFQEILALLEQKNSNHLA